MIVGMENFFSLLEDVYRNRLQYDEEILLKGGNFNLFKILNLKTNEVRTHSAFLGELLKPYGEHGQGDIFLKEFLACLNINDFNSDHAIVEIEWYIGRISEDKKKGGFIDILIKDNKRNAIIIENKIHASDQENQLLRYKNYAEEEFSNYVLLYLTLDGKLPSEFGVGSKSGKYFREISYFNEIKEWLSACKEKVEGKPNLTESIKQYIYLINELTGQSNHKEMKDLIVNTIFDKKEYLKAFFEFEKNDIKQGVKAKLLDRFYEELNSELKQMGVILHRNEKLGLNNGESYFKISIPNLTNDYIIQIGFRNYWGGMMYGVLNEKQKYEDGHREIFASKLGKGLGYPNWLWLNEVPSPYNDWNEATPWINLIDGIGFKEQFSAMILSLKNLLLKME